MTQIDGLVFEVTRDSFVFVSNLGAFYKKDVGNVTGIRLPGDTNVGANSN